MSMFIDVVRGAGRGYRGGTRTIPRATLRG